MPPSSSSSTTFQFLPLGAIIQTFQVGETNIVQNFPHQSQYLSQNAPYFGETIGRVANRIKEGRIHLLDGKSHTLAVNNGPNHLHGGIVGWGKRIWSGPKPIGVKSIPGLEGGEMDGGESVRFTLKSEDGDEGYPGTIEASVTYTAGTQKTLDGMEVTVLGIEFQAELIGGAEETAINMTNHSYFNLLGAGPKNIQDTEIQLSTNLYLPVDDSGIPTGEPIPYQGIRPNETFTLGYAEPDIDDCFVQARATSLSVPIDTRSLPLERFVTAYHPVSGIHLEVWSTEPAFQFYTGKYIDVPAVEDMPARGERTGFCVEPSRYVNAVNVEEWKGQVLLKKGDVYGSRIVYRAWSEKD